MKSDYKKRYKSVLLCLPPLEGDFKLAPSPPTSIGYLSEYLIKHKIEHEVLDMRLGYTLKDLKNKIRQFKPDLIGFSVLASYKHNVTYDLINAIKSDKYDIIIGGGHSSIKGKDLLNEVSVQYSLKYEGEKTFVELCGGIPLEKIEGLIYRKNGEIVENPHNSFLDAKELPFPKYGKFELKKYSRKKINIVTSRGCPYSCTFCSISNVMGKKVRERTNEGVISELKFWYDQGYREFNVADDDFAQNKQRTIDLCSGIERSGMKGLYLSCGNGIRADNINREVLTAMKKAGFREFRMGVEVGNDKMLKIIKKGETLEQIEKAIKLSCDMGFNVGLNFLMGFPGETEEDIRDSFRLAQKYPVDATSFYGIIPFPGTELYEEVKRKNLLIEGDYLQITGQNSDEPAFSTPELSIEKRRELLNEARKIEEKIIRNVFIRNTKKKFGIFSFIITNVILYKPVYQSLVKICSKYKLFKKIAIFLTTKFNIRNVGNLMRGEMHQKGS